MVGQHIRALKGGRWIHAIDCGDETVLHLVEEAPPARVRRAYRPEFLTGSSSVEVVTHRERTFPAKEIVRRAYSRASDPALAAMFRDSEAFAEWCATGRLPGGRNFALEVPGIAAASAAPAVPSPAPAAAKPAPSRGPAPARKAAAGAKRAAKKKQASAPARKAKAAPRGGARAKPSRPRATKAARKPAGRKARAKGGAKRRSARR